MYQVKKSGRNGWQSFNFELGQNSTRKNQLHLQLTAALEQKRLQVHYQAIVRLTDQQIVKCEALVRWQEAGEMIPPGEFIPLAEETGLISQIDQFVLERATETLTALAEDGMPQVALSVNISPTVFAARDNSLRLWMEMVIKAAERLELTVEITERLLTEDSERALAVLNRLREKGIRIAIDDFGTGYSSLSYLTRFPIDIIKIDRSFIASLHDNATAMTLINAILSLSQKLSLDVVAEGVETESQMNFLKHKGCGFGQGYLLGKPLPAEGLADLLQKQKDEETRDVVKAMNSESAI
jgi:EAL domain-containing protein (putative c-di-GMP-specific phosphodiesterase class I)